MQPYVSTNKLAHITEQTSGFDPVDAEKVLLHFQDTETPLRLTTVEKPNQEYEFHTFEDEKTIEINHKNPQTQQIVKTEIKTIPANYLKEDGVLYQCVGVAVYRFRDI